MKPLRKKLILLILFTLWGIWQSVPTIIYFAMPREDRNDDVKFAKAVPDIFSEKHTRLGLDLQGGVQLVLGVSTDDAVDTSL